MRSGEPPVASEILALHGSNGTQRAVPTAPGLSGSLESCAVRHPAVIAAAAVLGAILLAGCGSEGVASPTPTTVIGTVATTGSSFPIVAAFHAQGRREEGQRGLRERRLRGLPHARRRQCDRHGRAEPRPAQARLPGRHRPGDERRRRACRPSQGTAEHAADRRRVRLRRRLDRRHGTVELPPRFRRTSPPSRSISTGR